MNIATTAINNDTVKMKYDNLTSCYYCNCDQILKHKERLQTLNPTLGVANTNHTCNKQFRFCSDYVWSMLKCIANYENAIVGIPRLRHTQPLLCSWHVVQFMDFLVCSSDCSSSLRRSVLCLVHLAPCSCTTVPRYTTPHSLMLMQSW